MKTKHLLLTLLLALMVPLAALAQVERTVTVNNGTDKYHRVPAYGGREINQWYRNEFVIDKAYLQEMAGKQIIKMELYVAQPVPSSYMATSGSYAVRIREKDWATSGSYSDDSPAFRINPITTLEDQQWNAGVDINGKGNIVVRFNTPFLYSGENNLVVQFQSDKQNWSVSPFGIDNLPLYYGVNHTGYALEYCNTEQEHTYLNGGTVFAKNQVRNFAPKVTFTYLDEATWANTNKPQNPVATALSSSSIRLSWEAGDYTGSNYQVLCVERGTTPNWSNAVTVSNTYYTFENLASNTTYDLYVRARTTVIVTYNSKAASATATTQHGGNLDEGPIVFDFSEGTHPNGLTVTGNDTHLVTYGGCLSYSGENTVTVTLPRLHFTNATNGLMLEFNMNQPQGSPNPVLVELVDEYQNETLFSQNLTCNSYQSFSFRLKDELAVSSVMLHNCYKIRFTATGPFSLYNINVRKLANVIPASGLAATEITTTSAQINWIDDNTNTHTLELYYRTKGYHNGEQGHWQGYVPVTGTSHILTGLTPYTEYEVMVKTIYGSDFENSATLTFGTLCPEQTVPYEQDFTGLTALPQYWRIEGETSSTTYHYFVDDDGITFTSSISGNWVSERNAYIILPYFGNLASLQFSFENREDGGYVTVGVMTDPFDVSSFRSREYVGNSIGTHNINFGYNWASDIQYGHIALQVNKGYYDGSVKVDSFVVTRLAAPTGLAVSDVTNTTATLSWNAGAATQWEVRYGTDANNYGTPVAVTEPTYTITGLTASTDYVAQVRAKYGDGLYSDWVSFEGFKTYYSAPIPVDENNPYSFGFQRLNFTNLVSYDGGWQLINKGLWGNNWKISAAPGSLTGIGNEGTNYSMHISSNGSDYQYVHRGNDNFGQTYSYASTVYATRVFTLAPGSYQFSYRWKCKGIHQSDYFRVALVPANTVLTASNDVPDGLSYNSLPTGWIALDGGEALNPMSTNYGFASYTTPDADRIPILGGDYMMVFVWHNDGTAIPSVVNPPVAIDNVGISCTTLITPPEMGNLVAAPTDTQATLTWSVPTCTLTPTSYEVEYATDASFTNALTATTNTNSVTLTGLTANTNYYVRIRSTYTTNGTTIYSDWSDARAFTTAMPIPTELTLVSQTTSWANVMWTPVALTLPEGQSININYSYQLTTDVNDWGEANEGLGNESWAENLAPGTYHFRVRTAIYDSNANGLVDFSDWSEPIQFTIAPWSEPVSVFPLTYSFDEWSSRFVDGITLDGDLAALEMANYNELLTPDGGENEYSLSFCSSLNTTACVVLPPLNPSTSDAMVSFWWYHHRGHENFPNTGTNDGVEVETSTDGISWTTASYGVVPRYDANFTGWKKYEFVFPATTNPTYLRLRFVGTTGDFLYCYLDDLTVRTFKSEQPYISYVGCNANTATITLYDYAVENGYHSSAFQVQYREWRDPSETQETWADYDVFVNQEPYTFENTLTVNGLQPTTLYEFRACARVSYGGYDFDWSDYCEPVRQWTDCGTYTITPSYTFTEGFEDEFYLNCWTADEGWEMQHEGGHSGAYCAYLPANTNSKMTMPLISSSGCNNVIIRFWSKGPGKVYAYYGQNFGTSLLVGFMSSTTDWVQYELSISYLIKNNAPLKISFEPDLPYGKAWYVDDIEIVANAYDKVFDPIGASYVGAYESNSLWFPNGVPTAEDNVMIMGSAKVGFSETTVVNTAVGNVAFSHHGSLSVNKSATLTANRIDATKQVTVYGTANVTTLNAAKANSVVVKDGGVLYAAAITGTEAYVTDRVVVEDGGQLKTDQEAFVTIKKNIGSYTAIEAENNVTRGGYYLISSPLNEQYFNPASAGACTYETEGGETVSTFDLYEFNYEYEGAEWRNYRQAPFHMINGRGFLYASRDGVNLTFPGRIFANHATKYFNPSYGEGATYDFNGWNLMGNPFSCDAYITYVSAPDAISFYRMNPSGSGFIAAMGAIKPMEGVFVHTTMTGQGIGFSRDDNSEPGSKLGINLIQGNVLVDNAIIRFGEGGELPKFSFSDNTSKVYIPMADDDYAVVSSQPVGVLPLNFEAAKDGTYTLSFEDGTEGLLYCHLIDNLTGADVDLLSAGDCGSESAMTTEGVSYTFIAKVDDYAYRFKVVFVAKDEDGSSTGSETFAFNNNGNWIIANEGRATLQVIDLNGRILSSEQIEGSVQTSIHQPAGLYLIRLLNGNDVKIQKVIVK